MKEDQKQFYRDIRSKIDNALGIDRSDIKETMNDVYRSVREYRDKLLGLIRETLENDIEALSLVELLELLELVINKIEERMTSDRG